MIELWIGSFTILLALLVAITHYKKLEPAWLRLFVGYLFITLLTQPIGYFYSKLTHQSNHFIFNVHQYLQFTFYLILYYLAIQQKAVRLTIAILLAIFLSFALCNVYFGQGFYLYNSHTYSIGAILTLISCVLYFWELFKATYHTNYFRIPMFWITTGIFFYFAGTVVYLSLFDYLMSRKLDPEGKIYMTIMLTLNVLLYSMIAYGLLPKKSVS